MCAHCRVDRSEWWMVNEWMNVGIELLWQLKGFCKSGISLTARDVSGWKPVGNVWEETLANLLRVAHIHADRLARHHRLHPGHGGRRHHDEGDDNRAQVSTGDDTRNYCNLMERDWEIYRSPRSWLSLRARASAVRLRAFIRLWPHWVKEVGMTMRLRTRKCWSFGQVGKINNLRTLNHLGIAVVTDKVTLRTLQKRGQLCKSLAGPFIHLSWSCQVCKMVSLWMWSTDH